jgi:hypothetical protein
LQVQSPVPEQVKFVASRHDSPVQHSSVKVQACPAPVQVLVWHVPLVEPAGIEHE